MSNKSEGDLRFSGPSRPSSEFPWFGSEPSMPVAKTVAAWHDLLGFRVMLDDMHWDLSDQKSGLLVRRLVNLINQNSHGGGLSGGEYVAINDGLVSTFSPDIYEGRLGSAHDLIRWIQARLKTHCITSGLEHDYRLPGLRSVICEGHVLVFASAEREQRLGQYRPISTQLNTALSRCYISDALGSKAGIGHSAFIDTRVIDMLVTKCGCCKTGEFLFLYGCSLVSEVERYVAQVEYVQLSKEWEAIYDDRSSWLQLGATIPVEIGAERFELREIRAFSPDDEPALLWFDCATGDMHGFATDGIDVIDESGQRMHRPIRPTDPHPVFLDEYVSCYLEFRKRVGEPPQWAAGPGHSSERTAKVLIDGKTERWLEVGGGVLVPRGGNIGGAIDSSHPWNMTVLAGDSLREAVLSGFVSLRKATRALETR